MRLTSFQLMDLWTLWSATVDTAMSDTRYAAKQCRNLRYLLCQFTCRHQNQALTDTTTRKCNATDNQSTKVQQKQQHRQPKNNKSATNKYNGATNSSRTA